MSEKRVEVNGMFVNALGMVSDKARNRTREALKYARAAVWSSLPKYNVDCSMTHTEEFDDLTVVVSVDVKPRLSLESEEDVWSELREKEGEE